MRGVDLYGRSPLSSGQELAGAAALFAASPMARSAQGKGPLRLLRPRKGGFSTTAVPGRRRSQLRRERAPRASPAQIPQHAPSRSAFG